MAKDTAKQAGKAIVQLRGQTDRRRRIGDVCAAVADQTKHSTRRLAYDLNGDPH